MRKIYVSFLALAAGAALAVPWNQVSRHTPVNTNLIGAVIGDGLTLTNGTISAAGGGLDGQAVTNIVEGVVAGATNGMVKVEGNYAHVDGNLVVNNGVSASDISVEYTIYSSDSISGKAIEARESLTVAGKNLGTAAFKDSSEFATATDEALVYKLITNRLSGVTFNFATVAGLYLAISNIVAAQGGAITNFPVIP